MLSSHYKDMLRALSDEKVEYLLVGAFAMALHGYMRTTGDLDIWVMPSPENADAVMRSLRRYGAPLFNLTEQDLQEPGIVFQIGVNPQRIDIITDATGLDFQETYRRSILTTIDDIEVRIPSIDDLIRNKRATGRLKDLADAGELERIKDRGAGGVE